MDDMVAEGPHSVIVENRILHGFDANNQELLVGLPPVHVDIQVMMRPPPPTPALTLPHHNVLLRGHDLTEDMMP